MVLYNAYILEVNKTITLKEAVSDRAFGGSFTTISGVAGHMVWFLLVTLILTWYTKSGKIKFVL